MADMFRFALVFVCCAFPLSAAANTGVLRGGEHGSFTRMTVAVEKDVQEWHMQNLGAQSFLLRISPAITSLDDSRLFDRIDSDRIASVSQTAEGLVVGLDCECKPVVLLEDARLIIIDVQENHRVQPAYVPVLPPEDGRFPERSEHQSVKTDLFPVDYSVMDRVHRTVSSQLSDTSHIQGFSSLAKALPEPTETHEPAAFDDVVLSDLGHAKACSWYENVWERINARSDENKENRLGASISADWADPDLADTLSQNSVLSYLSEGRLEEAKMAISNFATPPRDRTEFIEFEKMLLGSADIGAHRFGECNPLHDVLIATMRAPHDAPSEVKISVVNTFATFPIGLQMLLYPGIEPYISEISPDLFPELSQHHRAEITLGDRMPEQAPPSEASTDPDALAALTIELRGTELEQESWQAAFRSYLAHGRYFDALAALSTDAALDEATRERGATDLVSHLVDAADSVTFVEIALAFVPNLEPSPSKNAMSRLEKRLSDEGFTISPRSSATHQERERLGAAGADVETTQLTIGLDLPVEHPPVWSSDDWTVEKARERLVAAEALRREVTARLGR